MLNTFQNPYVSVEEQKQINPIRGLGTGYCVTCDTIISKNKAQCRKCVKISAVLVED